VKVRQGRTSALIELLRKPALTGLPPRFIQVSHPSLWGASPGSCRSWQGLGGGSNYVNYARSHYHGNKTDGHH
jgi:hypothetical protein